MFVHVFMFSQITDVCRTRFYYLFLNYVLKCKKHILASCCSKEGSVLPDCMCCSGKLFQVSDFLEFLFMRCQRVKYTNGK